MDQRDHIATLCVAGTVGVAATGLALGVQTGHDLSPTWSSAPGKRKWPGGSSLKAHNTMQPPLPSRRVVSQPVTSNKPIVENKSESSRSASLFRRQSRRDVQPPSCNTSDVTGSRGSSLNRSSLFRPRTTDTRSTSEQRDPSAGSSWLKRISMVSSPRASSPSAASSTQDSTSQSATTFTPDNGITLRNKLVKRSSSQRALSNDHASGTFFRRPATSHQRSATVQEYTLRETSFSTPVTPHLGSETSPIWRPFFSSGYQRKRHTSANQRDGAGPRTVSASNIGRPTLILGSQIEASDESNDRVDHFQARSAPNSRQRLKRSLSSVHRASRRRHVTDPTTQVTTEVVNGTITSTSKHSPLSPLSFNLPLETDISTRSPSFNSSPPIAPSRQKYTFRKRQSAAPSDPTTISSDNDNHIFSDDDSMEFHSDTAYDSLNTRATASSHSAFRSTKLDTIFNSPSTNETQEDTNLASLVQRTTLSDEMITQRSHQQTHQLCGIGITQFADQGDEMDFDVLPAVNGTPLRPGSFAENDFNMTPVPHRLQYFEATLHSSPPRMTYAGIHSNPENAPIGLRPRAIEDDDDDDDEEIDWSPKSEKRETMSQSSLQLIDSSSTPFPQLSPGLPQPQRYNEDTHEKDSDSEKQLSSIFDWSENQKVGADGAGGMGVRPKTVHGKQGNDGSRSRSSGRRGPTQVHLRSQSVPNNRDPNTEQPPQSISKFGTWGLGNKGVSEEWSDDFDFDDADEDELPQVLPEMLKFHENRKPSRGVKVPQAIIDRQASVHIQFGQVQEFMLLVEELKQLRARGAALQLLNTHSKQLWEDAESIIDLATINEEDDEPVRPNSPTSSDIFGEEIPSAPKSGPEESKKLSVTMRSTSSPTTSPHGRPRGESLAHAKNFLHSIHQSRNGMESSPKEIDRQPHKKLPFDTQDLKDLVVRSGVINRALKEIVRKAEGLSVSPTKTPPRPSDPAFSQIFTAPDSSPCPPFRKPGIPKSKSANSYPFGRHGVGDTTVPTSPPPTALVS